MANPINTTNAALLILDCQQALVQGYASDPAAYLQGVANVAAKARGAGLPVIYVRKSFRPGYPEVHDNNTMFSAVRKAERLLLQDPNTQIAAAIAPKDSDIVIDAHRVSAFEGSALSLLLRARKVDTLLLLGVTTSGVVLSTVRQGADLDYRLYVIGDLCADGDKAVHSFLLENIIPRQATVVGAADVIDAL